MSTITCNPPLTGCFFFWLIQCFFLIIIKTATGTTATTWKKKRRSNDDDSDGSLFLARFPALYRPFSAPVSASRFFILSTTSFHSRFGSNENHEFPFEGPLTCIILFNYSTVKGVLWVTWMSLDRWSGKSKKGKFRLLSKSNVSSLHFLFFALPVLT